MTLRSLRVATQFLTRVPVPAVNRPAPDDLASAASYMPLVGLLIGSLICGVMLAGERWFPPLTGVLAVLVWVGITGALHLDGLADIADATGAAHRDPQRLLAVLADPHIGTFGVVSVVLVLLLKTAALGHTASAAAAGLVLIPAWARLGTLAWSRWLAPIKPGQGAAFGSAVRPGWIASWMVVLLAASACVAPVLGFAPLIILGWGAWLRARVGGVNGDGLGAGIEVTETMLALGLCAMGRTGSLLG